MSSRKVYVTVTTRLIMRVEEGVEIDDVISDMDYDFTSNTEGANIESTEIDDYDISDSK